MTESKISPIYLFSDSQLLFWKDGSELFLKSILLHVSSEQPSAAYFGAANGNKREFFDLFKSAMEGIGIQDCHKLGNKYSAKDKKFLNKADIILLAGGDVKRGWDVLNANGLKDAILKRYMEGAVIIGVSAGAVHLGMCASSPENDAENLIFDVMQVVPYVIGVHEEKEDWANLKSVVKKKGSYTKGIGIPFGAGAIYHPDHSIEPVRGSICEIVLKEDKPESNLLFPAEREIKELSVQ